MRLADLFRQQAEAESDVLQHQNDIERQERDLCARVATLTADVAVCARVDLSALRSTLACVESEGRQLKDLAASLAESLRAARSARERVAMAEQQRKTLGVEADLLRGTEGDLEQELGEWAILERALGRDGIQALEIDAAGPELSALTNELLTSCFGERFEVRFVTQIPRADGKGAKEVFDVQVIDHDRGREGAVDSLSGGEKTIVSEAISLALAIYTGRHGGHRFETLFRDETAGQLDPDNAARYVAMLRRARVVGGFRQVIYIAQQPEVWQAADAVLWCEGGRVEVRA